MIRQIRRRPFGRALCAALAWAAGLTAPGALAGGPTTLSAPKAASPVRAAAPLLLHVPSPDWRDQVIYLAMIDRFADGDPTNNDQGHGEYNPSLASRFSGGDLKGLRDRLAYIQGLGATALWITPPVANQWLNQQASYGGYHGYWAENFMKVDRHFGTLEDYRRLSDGLHRRGMYLVQDIVVNHVGDFFHYAHGRDPKDPAQGWRGHPQSRPVTAPTQPPFNLNDPRRSRDRQAGIYHWTPDIRNHQDRQQELTHQMSGLDDLNTGNARVREALRRSYAHWIRAVGVDAFRVDTAFYVEPEFFEDFMWRPAGAGSTPGMAAVARGTGRGDFFAFGEGFGIDPPGQNGQGKRIESYMHTGQSGGRRLPGMLNFPLYGALGDVIARAAPTSVLGQRMREQVALHPRLHWMPTFLDNHDVDRFLATADERALRQGLATLFTLPGIPVIYYGTEQGFKGQRAAMFATGYGSQGKDHFRLDHPLAVHLRSLAELRRQNAPLRRGWPTVLAETSDDAGALAWRMSHEGEHLLVVLNTADEPLRLQALPTGSGHAATLEPTWGMDGLPEALRADGGGRVDVPIGARDLRVWRWRDPTLRVTARAAVAQTESPVELGRGASRESEWQTVVDLQDLPGDDLGPSGRYIYPLDPVYAQVRPADIRRVQLATRTQAQGQSLRITLTMAGLSTVWAPPNGFDHVAFTAFIELPPVPQSAGNGAPTGEPAARVMPLQDGELPGDMRWHRRLRAHGWSLAMFDAQGATPGHEGSPLSRGVKVAADVQQRTVSFTISPAALGNRPSLSGARVWINTWDWDARYRALLPQPQDYSFGGGRPGEPRIMDATEVLVLP